MKEKTYTVNTKKNLANNVVIDIKNIRKTFKVYYDKGSSFKEKLLFWKRNRHENRVVLDGITTEIKRGETIGLIGRNGCGKSTLLKIMTGIYWPNGGSLTISGRVSSLIELGAGFHPDMTGRENIYTNASIFGLSKKEIDQRLEDIIAFSELGSFIDNPVRTYSSGMYMRLAFSVAINVDADVLLIDEILAVGDANFQAKCFNRLRELKAQGITIVIVSHDLSTIANFCNRVIWISEGKIQKEGNAQDTIDQYLKYMSQIEMERLNNEKQKEDNHASENEGEKKQEDKEHFGNKEAIITEAYLENESGRTNVLMTGASMSIVIKYKIFNDTKKHVIGMGFNHLDSALIYGTNTQIDKVEINNKSEGTIRFHTDKLPLQKGQYKLNISIIDENGVAEDFYVGYLKFEVLSLEKSIGIFAFDHTWEQID